MAQLTITGHGTTEVADDQRLVLAIEAAGVDILHRCGGNAKCTTCRVTFTSGEPDTMTVAERSKLTERELLGQVRLSCQILCDHDMTVQPLMTLKESGLSDAGPELAPTITPDPEWTTRA